MNFSPLFNSFLVITLAASAVSVSRTPDGHVNRAGAWSGSVGSDESDKQADAPLAEEVKKARAAFRAVARSFEKVSELRADYLQLQESLLLAEPIETRGRIFLRSDPGCLVLRIDRPHPVRIRSDETSHRIYYPDDKRAERFVFKKNRLAAALISCLQADLEKIEQVFEIRSYALLPATKKPNAENGPRAQKARSVVTLRPKDERLREAIRELKVEFDLDAALPTAIEQINREGELVRLELSKVELLEEAAKDSEAIFDAELPKGTRLVETLVKEPSKKK